MFIQERLLHSLMQLCRFSFGTFEKAEFKKFLRMGFIFSLIAGIYATIQPLKDSILIQLTNISHLPYAKILSIVSLIPLIMVYTKFLDLFSREKMLIFLPAIYGIILLCFSIIIFCAQTSPNLITGNFFTSESSLIIVGYCWYIFIVSYGYFSIALFWAFSADTTEPLSAKKGFPLVVAIGQIGGIIFPYNIGGLPYRLGFSTDTLSIIMVAILSFFVSLLFYHFLKNTPSSLLSSFKEKDFQYNQNIQIDGLSKKGKSFTSHRYLICIFAINLTHETIVTIFDFNFKLAASTQYSGVALSHYLSIYLSCVNGVSFIFLILGISNIPRFLGVSVALAIIPIMMAIFLCGFITLSSLHFLFILIVISEALDYALNGPTLKQLYIPTSKSIRFKTQAWIEVLGPAASPGPFFNMLLNPLQRVFGEMAGRFYYFAFVGTIGFPLLALWFILALYLGRRFYKAVQEKKLIC